MPPCTRLPAPLSGIVTPMVTPLSDRDSLDHAGIERLVDHLVLGGVSGIFLLGTCGEGPVLPFHLQSELVDRVCELVHGRLPVLVGISNPSIGDSLGLAEHAADCGATAVVSTLPYYYSVPEMQQTGHLVRLARRGPLPLIVYNMPGCVPGSITPDMLRELADEPNIAGFKDSSGDLDTFADCCEIARQQRTDWCRLMGPEHLLADAIERGATGGVNGGSNVSPLLFCNLYNAAIADDALALKRLQEQAAVLGRLYDQPISAGSVIRGIKMALKLTGICEATTSELFAEPTAEQWQAAEVIVAQLATWGLASV